MCTKTRTLDKKWMEINEDEELEMQRRKELVT